MPLHFHGKLLEPENPAFQQGEEGMLEDEWEKQGTATIAECDWLTPQLTVQTYYFLTDFPVVWGYRQNILSSVKMLLPFNFLWEATPLQDHDGIMCDRKAGAMQGKFQISELWPDKGRKCAVETNHTWDLSDFSRVRM